jgi:hypothetical protein
MNIEQAILQLKNHDIVISCLLVSIGGVQIMIFSFIWSLYKRLDKLKKSLDEIEKAQSISIQLPDIYIGLLNTRRIAKQLDVSKEYRIAGETVREIFCKGADFYKQIAEEESRKKNG